MSLKNDCSLSSSDWEFVKKLTRIGHVQVLSYQVNILVHADHQDFGTDKDNRLTFPDNWGLEWVGLNLGQYENSHKISMTWRVYPKTIEYEAPTK